MKLTEITATSPKEIAERFCKKYDIRGATIRDDGVIDVNGHVVFDKKQFNQLPVQFGQVKGSFTIFKNKLLTSLKGCPTDVEWGFSIHGSTQLKSLEHGPTHVIRYYKCDECISLQSFEHIPPDFIEEFSGASCHQVKNLKGLPKKLESLDINNCTGITSLEGIPEIITNGPVNIISCLKLISLDYLPSEITNGMFEMRNMKQVKNLLALFNIDGKFKVKINGSPINSLQRKTLITDSEGTLIKIETIINKHLENPDRDEGMFQCRQELKDAGFNEYARIK